MRETVMGEHHVGRLAGSMVRAYLDQSQHFTYQVVEL
jgi:hypothetical protein